MSGLVVRLWVARAALVLSCVALCLAWWFPAGAIGLALVAVVVSVLVLRGVPRG